MSRSVHGIERLQTAQDIFARQLRPRVNLVDDTDERMKERRMKLMKE